jgi:Zn-dependent peptidase ImmA (M78 family)/transcriptional regulator with XRE-family HTH domain
MANSRSDERERLAADILKLRFSKVDVLDWPTELVQAANEVSRLLGEQIKATRERAGLTQPDLSAAIGLEVSAISKIENGSRSVKSDELVAIAAALGVSAMALLEPESFVGRLSVAARSGTATNLGSSKAKLLRFAEYHQLLAESGLGREPIVLRKPKLRGEWLRDADTAAAWVLKSFGEQFNASVRARFEALVSCVESLGIDVWLEPFADGNLLGAALTDEEFPLVFVNTTSRRSRALFTLAHELAHVLFGDGDGISQDLDHWAVSLEEKRANAFAACLLMPKARIDSIIEIYGRNTHALGAMLAEFEVSWETLVYRLHNSKVIGSNKRDELLALPRSAVEARVSDPALFQRLFALHSADALFSERAPLGLTKRMKQGYEKGVVSVRAVADVARADPDDLLDSFNAETGFLDTPGDAENLEDEGAYEGDPFGNHRTAARVAR